MEDKIHKRICFLDYDGVVNTPIWNEKGTKCSYGWPKEGKVNNFQAVQWLSEFCKKCDYDIVVTSTWRYDSNYADCLINGGLREGIEVLGKTDDLNHEHPWPEPTRGYEIKKYLDEHPEIKFYIIIDDENQFLPEQQHHFVHIVNDEVGFGHLEMQRCIDIYMRDLGHQSSFWDPKEPYKDNAMLEVDDCCYLGMREPIEEIIFSSKNNRVECTPDYILAHDTFSINGVKFKKVIENGIADN